MGQVFHFSNINLHVACNFFIQIRSRSRSIWDCSVVMLCIFQIIQQITTSLYLDDLHHGICFKKSLSTLVSITVFAMIMMIHLVLTLA